MDKKAPSDMKTTRWSITMWFTAETGYTKETLHQFSQAMPQDWAVEGQIEQGEGSDGRLHAQLFLKTPQTRGSRIAKFFPKCHIEEARKAIALQQYVHKEQTRVDEFKTVENKFPHWKEVRIRFYDWFVKYKLEHYPHRLEDDNKMKFWDEFICVSILEKMEVHLVGVNPQYRSAIMKYWEADLQCAVDRVAIEQHTPSVDKIDRQTKDNFLDASPTPPKIIVSPENITCRSQEGSPTVPVVPVPLVKVRKFTARVAP